MNLKRPLVNNNNMEDPENVQDILTQIRSTQRISEIFELIDKTLAKNNIPKNITSQMLPLKHKFFLSLLIYC